MLKVIYINIPDLMIDSTTIEKIKAVVGGRFVCAMVNCVDSLPFINLIWIRTNYSAHILTTQLSIINGKIMTWTLYCPMRPCGRIYKLEWSNATGLDRSCDNDNLIIIMFVQIPFIYYSYSHYIEHIFLMVVR